MGWEELAESLDDLETKEVYDGYFCSVKDAVVIIILGSLCGLQNFKQIHEWAITERVRNGIFIFQAESLRRKNLFIMQEKNGLSKQCTGCLMCISGKTAAESRAGMPSRI